MINLDQEDVIAMAEKKFDIKIGLKIFKDKASTAPTAISEKTSKYAMPKEQKADLKVLDPITRDVQILIEDSQTVQADAAGFTQTGPIQQNFYSGFMTNPTDDKVSDLIGFYFETDAPEEAVKKGSALQQWVQFKKTGDKEYKTVQCYSKVGDPFVSEVKSFQGRELMDDTSPAIQGKKMSAQNTAEKSKKKESYALDRDSGQYYIQESATKGNHVVPCLAVFDLGRSIVAEDEFLGDYEFKYGARFYDSDTSTEFKTTGAKDKTGSFTLPEADLGKLYEEDIVEDKAAITEIVRVQSFGSVKETFINN